jgi:hypothetical protein
MSRTKFVLLAAMSVCVISAVASAAASAALPEFLPVNTRATFTSTSGEGRLETVGGEAIECTADTNKGAITGPKTATLEVSFTGCKAFGIVNCTSKGAKSGELMIPGTVMLGFIKATTPLEVGGAFTISGTQKFRCSGLIEVEVEGTGVGKVAPINTSSVTGHLNFAQALGVQKPATFEGGAALSFKVSKDGGTSVEHAGEMTEDTITYSEAVTVDG